MSVSIVDVLEVIDVRDRNGQRVPVSDGAVKFVVQLLEDHPAVPDTGQRIACRFVPQPVLNREEPLLQRQHPLAGP